jgi:hypothetical protein
VNTRSSLPDPSAGARRRVRAAPRGLLEVHLDASGLGTFSRSALAYLRQHHPEHTIKRSAIMLYCPVAVVRTCDPALVEAVTARAGEKKFKSFVSVPVVIDAQSGDAHYYGRTPIIGAAFYRGFRRLASTVIADPANAGDATAA